MGDLKKKKKADNQDAEHQKEDKSKKHKGSDSSGSEFDQAEKMARKGIPIMAKLFGCCAGLFAGKPTPPPETPAPAPTTEPPKPF